MARILIAGVGNIFLGDDAFGTEVARRLEQRTLPDGVRVLDVGIRGLDLVYALLDPYDAVILVDAVPRGGSPGTLYVIEPDVTPAEPGNDLTIEAHALDPARVLRLAAALGGPKQHVLVVGCEPGAVEEMQAEMTEAVRQAVEEAIPLIHSLVSDLLRQPEAGAARFAARDP